jgi:hypothetical protein
MAAPKFWSVEKTSPRRLANDFKSAIIDVILFSAFIEEPDLSKWVL